MESIIAELIKALTGPLMAGMVVVLGFVSWKQQVRIDRMENKINEILERFAKSISELKDEVKDIKNDIRSDIKDVRDKLWDDKG